MIERLLVANRGEIAHRIFRTCRALGIETVAVYAADDAASPHIAAADLAVPLATLATDASYLDVAAIVAAMDASGADAVHPGYGFLAENPDLAAAVENAGKIFVGPSPATLRAGADKVEARRVVAGAGVPVLPGLAIDDATDLEAAAQELGFPLLIKARAGGGGRGMRLVARSDDIAAVAAGARREATAAFGDGRLYLERLVAPAKHIEVQILADHHGRVLHLGERDCTIQRRHQKLLEETPSISIDHETRSGLLAAAVTAATAISYVGAGTVEFLLDATGDFHFIEFNTRLQVEHTITEEVTGIDLVERQLFIAAGGRLPAQEDLPLPHGHAIQARIYAEDPADGYRPQPGPIYYVGYPAGDGIRVDRGVEAGMVMGTGYDTLLMKVIAHGPDRPTARRRLIRALRHVDVHGPETTAPLLRGVLAHPAFVAGEVATDFLDLTVARQLLPGLTAREEGRYLLAAALVDRDQSGRGDTVFSGVPLGWRNVPTQPQRAVYRTGDHRRVVTYSVSGDRLTASVGTLGFTAKWALAAPDSTGAIDVTLEVDGLRLACCVARHADRTFVSGPQGSLTLHREPRFPIVATQLPPGGLTAPLPGLVVATPQAVGTTVATGDVLVVIEAMKLEHRVVAPESGTVTTLLVAPGDQVDAGTLLAVVAPNPA